MSKTEDFYVEKSSFIHSPQRRFNDATTKTQNQVKSGLLLDVIVAQGPAILQLLASEDQPLLIWGNSLLVLDLGLYIIDGVAGLHLQGDGLASQSFDENLHFGGICSRNSHYLKLPEMLFDRKFVFVYIFVSITNCDSKVDTYCLKTPKMITNLLFILYFWWR
jgi:hypothetical protein